MNNNGFTLIELISTIVLLSIILLVAVPSINNISDTIKKSNRDNIIKRIEIAATKYAYEKKESVIYVDNLIKDGFLTGDDNDLIIDPVDNTKMNCYMVEIEKNGNSYEATFKDGIKYEVEDSCDNDKLSEMQEVINVDVLVNENRIDNTDNWIKGKINLRAYSSNVLIDCNNNECLWTSSSGAKYKGMEVNLDVDGILNTKYNFQMLKKNDDGSIKKYVASVKLKIDNEPPNIYEDEIIISNKFIEESEKKVTIIASDGKGSGISKYYLGITNNECKDINDSLWQKDNNFNINSSGNYLICVKDNVGNISSLANYNISYIN